MRAIVTRVASASVEVDGAICGQIGKGLLVLLGVGPNDTEAVCKKMAEKITAMRIFSDANDKMNLAMADVGGSILVVSQFTLFADTKKGNRPSFIGAAPPALGETLYESFLAHCERLGVPTQHGVFGAHMEVASVNDGPVSIIIDTDAWK